MGLFSWLRRKKDEEDYDHEPMIDGEYRNEVPPWSRELDNNIPRERPELNPVNFEQPVKQEGSAHEVILARLDVLNAKLDTLNQRLINLERFLAEKKKEEIKW